MLCQFSVKNYKCLKNEITLDMQATNITEHNESVIVSDDNEKFLPLGVLYGPNGSGKTTVLDALHSFLSKIMRPVCAVDCQSKECLKHSEKTFITPYKFDKESQNKPSEFEIFFRTKTNEYQYCLQVQKDKVITENLSKKSLTGTRYSSLFTRNGSSIVLKHTFKNFNCSEVSDNLPVLSFLCITHKRNAIVRDILNWLEDGIDFINYGNPRSEARVAISKSERIKSLVLKMMSEMDIDISDYRTEEDEIINVYTSHIVDGKKYELELSEESNGTIKVFGILPFIADCLLKGSTLVIDELDAKIHPTLLKYIIGLFSNPNTNKKGSQLIFTSHDLSTMSNEVFRRDEIWFIAKGADESSVLYSLIEFKKEDGKPERKDARYDKRYLEGRYGADPYLKKIINWEEYK